MIVVRSVLFETGLRLKRSPKGLTNGPRKVPDEHQKSSRRAAGRAREGFPQNRGPLLSFHVPPHLPPSTQIPPPPSPASNTIPLGKSSMATLGHLCNIPYNAIPTGRLERCRSPSAWKFFLPLFTFLSALVCSLCHFGFAHAHAQSKKKSERN